MNFPRHVLDNHDLVARISQKRDQLFAAHQVRLHDGDLQNLGNDLRLASGADPLHGLLDSQPDLVTQFLLGEC